MYLVKLMRGNVESCLLRRQPKSMRRGGPNSIHHRRGAARNAREKRPSLRTNAPPLHRLDNVPLHHKCLCVNRFVAIARNGAIK